MSRKKLDPRQLLIIPPVISARETSAQGQGDAQVFKKYSQMKLQMKREALEKLSRRANEMPAEKAGAHSVTVTVQ